MQTQRKMPALPREREGGSSGASLPPPPPPAATSMPADLRTYPQLRMVRLLDQAVSASAAVAQAVVYLGILLHAGGASAGEHCQQLFLLLLPCACLWWMARLSIPDWWRYRCVQHCSLGSNAQWRQLLLVQSQ